MSFLVSVLFWKSQILIYIIAISDLGKALIMARCDARVILLKMWVFFIILYCLYNKILLGFENIVSIREVEGI